MNTPFEYLQAWADFNDECKLGFDAMPDSPVKRRAQTLLQLSDVLLGYCHGCVDCAADGTSPLPETEQRVMLQEEEVVALLAVNALLLHPDDPALQLATHPTAPPIEVQRGMRFGATPNMEDF